LHRRQLRDDPARLRRLSLCPRTHSFRRDDSDMLVFCFAQREHAASVEFCATLPARGSVVGERDMFFPESMYQYTWVLAPLVSIVLVILVALIGNAIVFPSIVGNAIVKVIVHAPIFFALKMAYLMHRAWPAYLKQTSTPSITDFVVRRAAHLAPSVAASAAILLIVALVANAIAHGERGRNVWVTALAFALTYGAIVYGARTNAGISMPASACWWIRSFETQRGRG
jgi:hypothetical protein